MRVKSFLLGLYCAAIGSSAVAQAPQLAQPVDCELGKTCYIQNYVDVDPRDDVQDFTCNSLSYNNHTGTDFGLPYRSDVDQNVAVLAAADGVVRGLRDGEEDGAYIQDPQSVAQKECGNGIVLDHGKGWHTQYCHLKQASVTVKKGQRVSAGEVLGYVGMSGKAEFPHVHFSVRHGGQVVDPFDPSGQAVCSLNPAETLWMTPVNYQAGGLLGAGFAAELPSFDEIKRGNAGFEKLSPKIEALVIWAYFFGSQKGDVVELTISGPQEFTFKHRALIKKNQALAFRAAGKRRKESSWAEGLYEGQIKLVRKGELISWLETTVEILP